VLSQNFYDVSTQQSGDVKAIVIWYIQKITN